MKIHRFYEVLSEHAGLLHDVHYDEDDGGKAVVKSLQTHAVRLGEVEEKLISHENPLNAMSLTASFSILLMDKVIDNDANLLVKH